MRLRFVLVLVAILALHVDAQEFETVLLPVAPQTVQGAFGSRWVTDLVITNLSTTRVRVSRPPTCFPECATNDLPGKSTVFVPNLVPASNVTGQLARVEKGRLRDVAMTLRSRDTSRQSETWGTSVPVVATDHLFSGLFGLVDVPMDPQFRSTLRIYDVNAATPPRVRLRVYAVNPFGSAALADQLIREFEPSFAMPLPGQISGFPASAEIPLWLDSELLSHSRIRIEIEPLDAMKEYWAFVSITHNSTQHVTLITPQP